jgi:mono/diheme cytochrome c family protein
MACLLVVGLVPMLLGQETSRETTDTTAATRPSTDEEALAFFESDVLPILKQNCFECHGGGDKVRAEFVLTNREDLLAGGESGPAIDLESPSESLLLSAINYDSYEMPPAGKLPQAEIDIMTRWVELGAPWKGDGFKPETVSHKREPPKVNEQTKQWWSYQKPQRPEPPAIDDPWISNSIDQFVLAKLRNAELEPNPPASRQTLVRRVYYDLIGLPPTPAEVNEFVNDPDPNAYQTLVDKLLDSPHYGEKWARHWLDLVRYAESNSYERDGTKPFVWRYRDYVIRAFNDNKPYDHFLFEQIAGDELPGYDPDHLIATGYYRLGKWDDEPVDHEQAFYDDMDDVMATTGQAFLGMTINCARCHDHKIDPIPQTDYYRLLAFFRNVQRYGVRAPETVTAQSTRPIVPVAEIQAHDQAVEQYRRAVDDNDQALKEIESIVKQDFIPVEFQDFNDEMNRVPLVRKRIGKTIEGQEFTEQDAARYEELFGRMRWLRENPPAQLESALCVTEIGPDPLETNVLVRGVAQAKGDLVEPGFPSVLSPPEPEIQPVPENKSTGRRTALARWLVSPDNPLTARVMVNRIWQHHFGRGIVRSSNDFGFQGTPPTHPELLDWLAVEFMDSGWDIKHMHRLMMNSSTYRMSSANREDAYARDSLNDLFWRFNMQRLTAEEVRDSILAVNESLNLDEMFGPSIYPTIPAEVLHGQSRPGENWFTSTPEEQARRSIYIHIKRSLPVPLMASFDVADPDSSCPVRFNTVQPTQALGMLNSTFINEEAAKLAASIRKQEPAGLNQQIRLTLQRVFQRDPTDSEVERGVQLVEELRSDGTETEKSFDLFCVVALNLNEFLYLD